MFEQDYLKEWNGIPVKQFSISTPPELEKNVYKLGVDWDGGGEDLETLAKSFFDLENVAATKGIILGLHVEDSADDYYNEAIKPLLENKDKLPNLNFLFLGEMNSDDSELSWIGQGDVGAPVLDSFPGLQDLRARGGLDYEEEGTMKFSACRHIGLQKLVLQTISMRKEVLQGVGDSVFPALEYLELWLGSEGRERTTTVEDLKQFLEANPFPKLKYLGLNNCDIITEIAEMIADLPIIDQLETLDLSGGTLQDKGAEALLASDRIKTLKKLDLHHHYLSEGVMAKLQALDIEVDVSEQEEADDGDYYVSVDE